VSSIADSQTNNEEKKSGRITPTWGKPDAPKRHSARILKADIPSNETRGTWCQLPEGLMKAQGRRRKHITKVQRAMSMK